VAAPRIPVYAHCIFYITEGKQMPFHTAKRLYLPILLSLLTALPVSGADSPPVSDEDLADAFATAGFEQDDKGNYIRCQEDPPTMSYMPGQAEVTDLNGDGIAEIWITEGSLFCYGHTGNAFVLLTRDGSGWRVLLDEVGMHNPLNERQTGWPDIEVGGPGFGKFPVYRWDGHYYKLLK